MEELREVIPPKELTPEQEKQANLAVLIANLRAAKRSEETAKANRIAIEEMLAELVPGKEIGQTTTTLPDGSKVVVTRGYNYKADLEAIREGMKDSGMQVPIEYKTTEKLDITGYEWYRENHPREFSRIAKHVTVTPKKVSVVLKDPKSE